MGSISREVSVTEVATSHVLRTASSSVDHDIAATDFRIRCYNYTHTGIWTKTRLGVNTFLEPMKGRNGHNSERLIIELEWRVHMRNLKKMADDLHNGHFANSDLTKQIVKAFDDEYRATANGNRNGYTTVAVQVIVYWEELAHTNGVFYLTELDLQFVAEGTQKNGQIEHPFSPIESIKKSLGVTFRHITPGTFAYTMKIVDNKAVRERADRYMLMGGEVYKMPVERDANLQDGVHLVCKQPISRINNNEAVQDLWTAHYSFEQADALFGLRTTPEEARLAGEGDTAAKLELARFTHDAKLEEIRVKQQLGREEAERAQRERIAKEQIAERRAREEEVKDNAKNFSDWMKLITGVMAIFGGFLGALNKLKPT